MDTCPNCGAFLSCGCQRRTASDGKVVCQNCLENYEYQLTIQKTQKLADENKAQWLNN